jgi:hypothetical protein
VPSCLEIGIIAMGNQIVTKLSMYYTNCHDTIHNVETCKNKKKNEPIVTTIGNIA